jgi:hypothetical protein
MLFELVDRCKSAEKELLVANEQRRKWKDIFDAMHRRAMKSEAELKELREQKPVATNVWLEALVETAETLVKSPNHHLYNSQHLKDLESILKDKPEPLDAAFIDGFNLGAQSRDSAEPVGYGVEVYFQDVLDPANSGEGVELYSLEDFAKTDRSITDENVFPVYALPPQSNVNAHSEQVNPPDWCDISEDSLGRLYVGRATEGDQLQAYNAIMECQVFADMYGEFKEKISPHVSDKGASELPASVTDSFGVIFDHWLATKGQQSPAVAVPEYNADLVCAILEDYADMQASGFIPSANRYSASDAIEQVGLISLASPQVSAEQKDKIFKIGQLAATLDCMDMDEAWARQDIFDIVTELTGKTVAEMFAAAKQSAQDEGKV